MQSQKGAVEMIMWGKDPTRWREYFEDDELINDPDVAIYSYTDPHVGIADQSVWDHGYGASVPISRLREAAKKGCKCCAIVLDGLYAYKPLPFELREETDVSWTENWRGDKALNVELRTQERDIALEIEFYVHGDPWRVFGTLRSVPRNSESEACHRTMAFWLSDCLANHPRCHGVGLSDAFPRRLIDIGESLHNEEIKLIDVNSGFRPDYLTLSHCWGRKQIITTSKATLNERMDNISWPSLSKTFQDAISLTRKLGYRYIWIDSLCIIQDDVIDWQIESAKMADIYENSILTISVNMSKDGDGGCFADRYSLERNGTRHEVESLELQYDDIEGQPLSVFVRRPLISIEWENEAKPLFDRAWTFQERLLSKRILHFNNRELVWECDSMKRCECGQHDESRDSFQRRRPEILTAIDNDFQNTQEAEAVQQRQIQQWRSMVLEYAGKALTKRSDKLPALSGIAKRANILCKGAYLAGIWEAELPEGLLWGLCTPLSSRAAVDPSLQRRNYRAPTWSWASIEGQPNIVHERKSSYVFHAEINKAHCLPSGLDPTGEVSEGCIIITAPFTPISIQLQTESQNDPTVRGRGHIQIFRLDGHGSWVLLQDANDSLSFSTEDSAAMEFVEKYKPLYCLKIRTEECQPPRPDIQRYWSTEGLLLNESTRNVGGYERLGIARLQTAPEWDVFAATDKRMIELF